MESPRPEPPPPRTTYRHGDLRRVLLEAGVALARAGGPDAVMLREATRRAGVVPNAAYRHFANRDDLLAGVRSAALSALGDAIEAEMATIDAGLAPPMRARALLRAVGLGYMRFATSEPGLFRAAFVVTDNPTGPTEGKSKAGGLNPFELLGTALDAMAAAGVLPAARRPGAEFPAWSAVHGFAMLLNEGPLSRLPQAQREATAERLVEMVERGL